MANKSSRYKQPALRVYVRIYPEHDLTLIAYLRDKAKREDRSIASVLKQAAKKEMEANG